MVFFQAALLLGYLYAHTLTGRVRRFQSPIHLTAVVVAALTLPIALPSWAPPAAGESPALHLLVVLVVMVGAPFVAVSTTGPLLQRWFSLTTHRRASDPYFLYAASNVGSFIALLGYPALIEPRFDLHDQTRLWAAGYAVFVVLLFAAVAVRHRYAVHAPAEDEVDLDATSTGPIPWRRRARWIGLAFLPSSLMLGVTTHITTDVAAVPLLWVLPLSAYLATFVVAFGRAKPTNGRAWGAGLVGVGAAATATMARDVNTPLLMAIGVHLVLFTALAYVAHRRLADDRPGPEHLTAFYLALAVGGVLGGIANALVAPVVFQRVLEYPIVVAVALVVLTAPISRSGLLDRYGRLGRVLDPFVAVPVVLVAVIAPLDTVAAGWTFLPLLALALGTLAVRHRSVLAVGVAVVLVMGAVKPEGSLAASRTFFGVYRVYESGQQRVLEHGSTIHGAEWLDPARRDEPLGYYGAASPIAHVFDAVGDRAHDVSVVGLGVGALATFDAPDRRFTFYEIDPEVERLARRWFHYLEDTTSPVEVVIGDGRLELASATPASADLVVIDAFSSDSIPVHLLTEEAVSTYLRHLAPGGVLVLHISNQHLDLVPVVAGIAHDLGLAGAVQTDVNGDQATATSPSQWVVLAPDASSLSPILAASRWDDLATQPRQPWTDSSSNLLAVLR
jgi:SAM-dependent methyltransferase